MSQRVVVARALALVALTTLAFAPGLDSPFTLYDDGLYVTDNAARLATPGWAGLARVFDPTDAWTAQFIEYFPLRDAVYWLLVHGFGLVPWPFHVVGLAFHLLASLLAWRLLRTLEVPEDAAWLGALLFALHPVHVESVVWVAGLKDPMYACCFFLGLDAYLRYRRAPRPRTYAVVLGALVAGFLIKSLIVALPVVMLGAELLLPPRAGLKTIAARLAGPFVISALFMAQIVGIGRANGVLVPPHGGSWLNHVVLAAWAQVKYLKQAFVPTSYRLIYCFEPARGLTDARLWVAVLVLALVLAAAWRFRQRALVLFFFAFYAAAMAPASNLLPFPAIMADRYLYVPSLAACALVAWAVAEAAPQSVRALSIVLGLVLCATTAARAWVWRDEERLWEEPDEDPACLVDPSFPAAQAHVMRFQSATDPQTRLAAAARAIAHPDLGVAGRRSMCTAFIVGTTEALDQGRRDLAERWSKLAVLNCPQYWEAWNVSMAVWLHRDLETAAQAAARAWRLKKTPELEALMWLTRLERGESAVQPELERLAAEGDRGACEKITGYFVDVPALGPQLLEPGRVCGRLLREGPRP